MGTGTSLSETSSENESGEIIIRLPFTSPVTLGLFPSNWRGSVGSTALEQEKSIGSLASLYTFRDHVQVTNFLREAPFLVNLLAEAYEAIQRYFDSDAQVTLEVFTDPEAEDSQQLVAFIHIDLPLQEEVDLLENFYDEWWLDVVPAVRGKLHIDVE